jgi:hypothetical protein
MDPIDKGATFSVDGQQRYKLWRIWDRNQGLVLFVMLNPSKADAIDDDRTITKCTKLAKAWRYGGFYVGNLFAKRATNPMNLHEYLRINTVQDKRNERSLMEMREASKAAIVAWGNHASRYPEQVQSVLALIGNCSALRITKAGHPSHPLYLPYGILPERFKK